MTTTTHQTITLNVAELNERLEVNNSHSESHIRSRRQQKMDIKTLTASKLDKALSRADNNVHKIMDELIAQGRGYEKISQIRAGLDDLSRRAIIALDAASELHDEEMRRLRYHASLRRITT